MENNFCCHSDNLEGDGGASRKIARCCGEIAENNVETAEDKSEKRKVRKATEKKDLLNRLSRIEGQVRGIMNMVENDAYCTDILTQAAAVNAAMNSFNKILLASHVRSCVVENVRSGNEEVIDELVNLLQKLMK